jgi:hypothetical protein
VRVTPHCVGQWRLRAPARDRLDGTGDSERSPIASTTSTQGVTALRLELRGALDLRGGRASTRSSTARAICLRASTCETRSLRIAAADADLAGLALSGFAARAVAQLAGEGARRQRRGGAARDALALLVRLAAAPETAP